MLLDKKYKYEIITETEFNNKYLVCKSDGSKYKKYLLIKYKENNIIKFIDIPNEEYINRFDNVIKIYNVEEIISTCTEFDSMYEKLTYFHIDDIYFKKFLMSDDDIEYFKIVNDYEKIEKIFM